jgi:hypothetical protein
VIAHYLRRRGRVLVALLTAACHGESHSAIQLQVGNASAERRSFVPRSALAEYLELPKARSELRLIFADYEASCERFVPPTDEQTFVSVLVVAPAGQEPTTGTYPWGGHQAHGGTATRPKRPFAMPKAQLGARSYLFPPGGAARLAKVSLAQDGYVQGSLCFEFSGNARQQATRLQGEFRARVCRSNRLPGP